MRLSNENVLITGGAGFIGSHLVEEYLKEGVSKIVVLDDFTTGERRNLDHITDPRLKLVEASILDKRRLNNTVREEKIGIIEHLAAELEVYTGIKDAIADANTNIFGTLNVLNAALKHNVKKIQFASSGAVYGEA